MADHQHAIPVGTGVHYPNIKPIRKGQEGLVSFSDRMYLVLGLVRFQDSIVMRLGAEKFFVEKFPRNLRKKLCLKIEA